MIKSKSFDSISQALEWCNGWHKKDIRVINIFADEFTNYGGSRTYAHNYIVVYEEEDK